LWREKDQEAKAMADCVRELAESGLPVPLECEACGHGLCKRDAEEHGMHYAQMQMALRDCIPFLAVQMDRYRREGGMEALHPTHAAILDRVSALVGGDKLSEKLKA
jgi:hypothetical protein